MQTTDTAASTAQPHAAPAGFPPFKTETFPAQFFWLAVTFAVLFVVMWRVAVPRIAGSIGLRRGQIDGDLAAAEAHRKAAEELAAAHEAARAEARKKAHSLAEENRQLVQTEIDAAKARADAAAQAAMRDAEASIAQTRDAALAHLHDAATDAARAIVARLIGDDVPADEAAAAVRAATGQ